MWLAAAVFGGLTAILAKCGVRETDSDLATAIRTVVVLLFSWLVVLAAGSAGTITEISPRSLLFLVLSGAATGASWLCYYAAIQSGKVSVVVPVDKMSLLLTVGFSRVFLGEKLSRTALLGLLLMVGGTLLMAVWA